MTKRSRTQGPGSDRPVVGASRRPLARFSRSAGTQVLRFELIARAAQLSVGAIYLYFPPKEDLYVSLIEDTLTVFDVEMAQLRERAETRIGCARRGRSSSAGPRKIQRDRESFACSRSRRIRPQLSDEVVTAVSAGINRVQDPHRRLRCGTAFTPACTARSTPGRSPTWHGRCCSAASTPPRLHTTSGSAPSRWRRAPSAPCGWFESALAPPVAGSLRAVA